MRGDDLHNGEGEWDLSAIPCENVKKFSVTLQLGVHLCVLFLIMGRDVKVYLPDLLVGNVLELILFLSKPILGG